jgi:hypothetical protein
VPLPMKSRPQSWLSPKLQRWGVAVSMGADSARKRTLWGSSALEMGDHRLFEDGSERGGALVADRVASETASERWGGDGERVGVSMGIDRKANTLGRQRTLGL